MTAVAAEQLLPLAVVLGRAPAGHQLADGVNAWWRGLEWRVAATLERTAVLVPATDPKGRRELGNHRDVLVDPDAVIWRPTDRELLAQRKRAARGRQAAARNAQRRASGAAA